MSCGDPSAPNSAPRRRKRPALRKIFLAKWGSTGDLCDVSECFAGSLKASMPGALFLLCMRSFRYFGGERAWRRPSERRDPIIPVDRRCHAMVQQALSHHHTIGGTAYGSLRPMRNCALGRDDEVSRLAQGKMRAAERHRGPEAQRRQSGEHARDRRNWTRRRGRLAGSGQHQHADRDQELPHPLRDLT
jgi:hypothetical protein